MQAIIERAPMLPAMSEQAIEKARQLEAEAAEQPQVEIQTKHLIHAGLYQRTIKIPAGVLLTGALIKIPTTLVVSGDCMAYIGGETLRLTGYHVLAAMAGRKQAFVAITDTFLTMSFPTSAKTVEQAEEEFTDECHLLCSRRGDPNDITITGE
jgi:hypothetical protein